VCRVSFNGAGDRLLERCVRFHVDEKKADVCFKLLPEAYDGVFVVRQCRFQVGEEAGMLADEVGQSLDLSENDTDSDSDIDEDDKEYYTELIDGVRYLQYRVIVCTEFPPPTMPQGNLGNSGNANEPVQASSSIDNAMNTSSSNDTYEWGGAITEPTWGTWRTRPNLTPLALEDSTWGQVTKDWERRDKVITQGRSPPPKLRSEPNLFQDGRIQGIPIRDPRASDDLAFKTGRRAEGTTQPQTSRSIPTHPNSLEPLSKPFAPYPNFVPETDTEDDGKTTLNNTQAQPKPPKRQKRHSTRVRSFKDEDIGSQRKRKTCQCTPCPMKILTAA
jgi:hypothetical protein